MNSICDTNRRLKKYRCSANKTCFKWDRSSLHFYCERLKIASLIPNTHISINIVLANYSVDLVQERIRCPLVYRNCRPSFAKSMSSRLQHPNSPVRQSYKVFWRWISFWLISFCVVLMNSLREIVFFDISDFFPFCPPIFPAHDDPSSPLPGIREFCFSRFRPTICATSTILFEIPALLLGSSSSSTIGEITNKRSSRFRAELPGQKW